MTEHCCKEMTMHLASGELHFVYMRNTREYAIDYKKEYGGGVQLINYCPWCGDKLPKSLREELGNIVFNQLKLDSFPLGDDPKTPKEFKTDEWWKKRNL
jgi:hypothetical protein